MSNHDPAEALPVGSRAPDFTLPDAAGEPHSLSGELESGPVLLVFFKISCPTSQYSLPFIERLWQQLQGTRVRIWAISQDSPEHTAAFNKEFSVTMPQLFDSEDEGYAVSNAYGVTHVPSIFLVEPDGKIVGQSVGFNKKELEEFTASLAEMSGRSGLDVFSTDKDVPLVRPGCASKN